MIRMRKGLKVAIIGVAGTICMCSAASAALLDLRSGGIGTINGGIFGTVEDFNDNNGTGSGNYDPFVRIQALGTDSQEEGYNSNINGSSQSGFDEKPGTGTDRIQYSDLNIFDFGGVDYVGFSLDIAEGQGGASEVTLDMLQLFTSQSINYEGNYVADPTFPTAGYNPFGTIAGTTKIWDMDDPSDPVSGAEPNNRVALDAGLVGSGNGKFDMVFYVMDSLFRDQADFDEYNYVVLYSNFGINVAADNSFEEWANLKSDFNGGVVIPLPAPFLLLLGGIGALGIASRKRKDGVMV